MPGGHKKGLIEKILNFKQSNESKKKKAKGLLEKSEPSIDNKTEKIPPLASTSN